MVRPERVTAVRTYAMAERGPEDVHHWLLADHPAPEVSTRDATDDEIGSGASRVRSQAARCGWETRVTYARGNKIDHVGLKWSTGGLIELVAVRATCVGVDGRWYRAVATWSRPLGGGGWTTAGAWAWTHQRVAKVPLTRSGDPDSITLGDWLENPLAMARQMRWVA